MREDYKLTRYEIAKARGLEPAERYKGRTPAGRAIRTIYEAVANFFTLTAAEERLEQTKARAISQGPITY